jgi:hypothetical protein
MEENKMKATIFAMEAFENGEGNISVTFHVTDIDSWKKIWVNSSEIEINVNFSSDDGTNEDDDDFGYQ